MHEKEEIDMDRAASRPRIDALDPMRALTAVGVVGVHALALTLVFEPHGWLSAVQNLGVVSLHFTRAIFMFITAFALIYVYSGRQINWSSFWRKRAIGVLFPYAFWSLIYMWQMDPASHQSVGAFFHTYIFDLFTGNAAIQLYFILLSLQFYCVFPIFLWLLKKYEHHHWAILAVTFAIQLAMFLFITLLIQNNHLGMGVPWKQIQEYQDRPLLMYPFYFTLGGVAAWHFNAFRTWLASHSRTVLLLLGAGVMSLWIQYTIQVTVLHLDLSELTGVLQPIMLWYSVTVILFAAWAAFRWSATPGRAGRPVGMTFWHELSEASFGVYLLHVFFVVAFIHHLWPWLPVYLPVWMRAMMIWGLSVFCAYGLSIILMHTPLLSRLVGRATSVATWQANMRSLSAKLSIPHHQAMQMTLEEQACEPSTSSGVSGSLSSSSSQPSS